MVMWLASYTRVYGLQVHGLSGVDRHTFDETSACTSTPGPTQDGQVIKIRHEQKWPLKCWTSAPTRRWRRSIQTHAGGDNTPCSRCRPIRAFPFVETHQCVTQTEINYPESQQQRVYGPRPPWFPIQIERIDVIQIDVVLFFSPHLILLTHWT